MGERILTKYGSGESEREEIPFLGVANGVGGGGEQERENICHGMV